MIMADKYTLEQVKLNIETVRSNIRNACMESGRNSEDVTLLAATKTVSPDVINYAISNGIGCIGENRVQELLEKYDSIDRANTDIHFIGHLQTNKVKYIADKVSMIHSVDSEKLACEIDRQSYKHGKRMDVLVEVNVGNEASKGGVSPEECLEFVEHISHMENIRICGLMSIPPKIETEQNSDNILSIERNMTMDEQNAKKIYKNRCFFEKMMKLFLDIMGENIDNINMNVLSMGMSDDYEEAIRNGATIVRVGRTLFGSRI